MLLTQTGIVCPTLLYVSIIVLFYVMSNNTLIQEGYFHLFWMRSLRIYHEYTYTKKEILPLYQDFSWIGSLLPWQCPIYETSAQCAEFPGSFSCIHSVRCMHAVVWKMHGYCFKNSVFYKEKKVPNPLEASTEGLKSILNAKTIF